MEYYLARSQGQVGEGAGRAAAELYLTLMQTESYSTTELHVLVTHGMQQGGDVVHDVQGWQCECYSRDPSADLTLAVMLIGRADDTGYPTKNI